MVYSSGNCYYYKTFVRNLNRLLLSYSLTSIRLTHILILLLIVYNTYVLTYTSLLFSYASDEI